jgi:outer membrane lipoprotein-sorting protein
LTALLLGACLQVGCAARKPLTYRPEIPAPPLETAEDAKQLLFGNYGSTDSLKAGGKIDIEFNDGEQRRQASFVVMLQRPDRVRMRAYRALTPTLFEIISNGQRCWLHSPSEKIAYVSEGCRPFLGTDNGVAFSAEAIVTALVVVADFDSLTSSAGLLYREGDLVRLVVKEETGTRKEIWIDPIAGLVTRQALVAPDGTLEADIAYRRQAFDGSAVVPVETQIDFPRLQVSMLLRIDDFRVHSELSADAFEFSPPRNTRILDSTSLNEFPILR